MRQWAKPWAGSTAASAVWLWPGVNAAAVVGQQRAEAPGDRVGRVVHLQAVDAVPDELRRPAALGADDGLVGAPAFQDHDAERLVAAGHGDHVAGLEQVVQLPAAAVAE